MSAENASRLADEPELVVSTCFTPRNAASRRSNGVVEAAGRQPAVERRLDHVVQFGAADHLARGRDRRRAGHERRRRERQRGVFGHQLGDPLPDLVAALQWPVHRVPPRMGLEQQRPARAVNAPRARVAHVVALAPDALCHAPAPRGSRRQTASACASPAARAPSSSRASGNSPRAAAATSSSSHDSAAAPGAEQFVDDPSHRSHVLVRGPEVPGFGEQPRRRRAGVPRAAGSPRAARARAATGARHRDCGARAACRRRTRAGSRARGGRPPSRRRRSRCPRAPSRSPTPCSACRAGMEEGVAVGRGDELGAALAAAVRIGPPSGSFSR